MLKRCDCAILVGMLQDKANSIKETQNFCICGSLEKSNVQSRAAPSAFTFISEIPFQFDFHCQCQFVILPWLSVFHFLPSLSTPLFLENLSLSFIIFFT